MAEWYKEWFASEDYLSLYYRRNDDDARRLYSLIKAQVPTQHGDSILDICCGAGRHSLLFAEEGYCVTGFDLSETLLGIAKSKAEENKLDINFFKCDVRHFSVKKKFKIAVSLFTSFGYFNSDSENFGIFNSAYAALKKEGWFVFDFLNKTWVENNLNPLTVESINDKVYTQKRQIKNGRVEKKIIIESDGKKEEFAESVRLYKSEELSGNIKASGFRIVKQFGDYLGGGYDPAQSPRIIYFAQK